MRYLFKGRRCTGATAAAIFAACSAAAQLPSNESSPKPQAEAKCVRVLPITTPAQSEPARPMAGGVAVATESGAVDLKAPVGILAGAPDPDEGKTLENLLGLSEFAFRGVVVEIQYKLSEPVGETGGRIPHTFVSFWVKDVIHGAAPDEIVTLRFIGGFSGEKMRYMSASRIPQFDLGDEDILFVRGNTQRMCPLVGNLRGRMRVIGDQVYTESGREVRLDGEGKLRAGARHCFPEVMSTSVLGGLMVVQRQLGAEAVDRPSDALRADEIVDRAKMLSSEFQPRAQFISANIEADLIGPDLTPCSPR